MACVSNLTSYIFDANGYPTYHEFDYGTTQWYILTKCLTPWCMSNKIKQKHEKQFTEVQHNYYYYQGNDKERYVCIKCKRYIGDKENGSANSKKWKEKELIIETINNKICSTNVPVHDM